MIATLAQPAVLDDLTASQLITPRGEGLDRPRRPLPQPDSHPKPQTPDPKPDSLLNRLLTLYTTHSNSFNDLCRELDLTMLELLDLLEHPAVTRALERLAQANEARAKVLARLTSDSAVSALIDLMDTTDKPETRRKAAGAILRHGKPPAKSAKREIRDKLPLPCRGVGEGGGEGHPLRAPSSPRATDSRATTAHLPASAPKPSNRIDTTTDEHNTQPMQQTTPPAKLGRSSLGTIAIMLLGVAAIANSAARAQTSAPPDAARPSAGSPSDADQEQATDLPSPEAAEGSKLRFTFTPYVWVPSLNGSISIKRATIDIDDSFIDILKDSDRVFGLMGALDLQCERFVFQFNGTWLTADVSDQDGTARSVDIDANVTLNTTWLELFAGYRIIETPLGDDPALKRFLTLDAFVGGRVTLVDVDADLKASATITLPGGTVLNPSASKTLSPSESWIEPFIGLRLGADLSERWAIMLRGDIGGFGAGSDFAWQAVGGVGYRWFTESGSITLFGGYRALSQDYTNGDFTWDLTVHGPMIGVAFTF